MTLGIAAETDSFNLLDARERNAVAPQGAKSLVTATFDEALKKDVLELDYTLPKGEMLTLSLKQFPAGFNSETASVAKVNVKTPEASIVSQIAVELEIKGTQGTQSIPLKLKSGWALLQETIDWTKVGSLSEVAFNISVVGTSDLSKGTLSFAVDFTKPASVPIVKVQEAVPAAAPQAASPVVASKTLPAQGTVQVGAKTIVSSVQEKNASATQKIPPAAAPIVPARSSFGLLDANDKGVSEIGSAKGSINFSFDEEAKKDVYDLGYSLSKNSTLRVWTKKFPEDLTASQVNTLEIGLRVLEPSQLNRIAIRAELKGTTGTQTLAITPKPGWNLIPKTIQWNKIGTLDEVAFVISPKGNIESTNGTLYLGFDFCQTTFLKKYLFLLKFLSVFGIGLLAALFVALLGRIFRRNREWEQLKPTVTESLSIVPPEPSMLARLMRDLFFGVVIVLIGGIALSLYVMGATQTPGAGFCPGFLMVALLGGLAAELLKWGYTRKHLTPSEIFLNVILTGILAVSTSRLELLQAPTQWSHLFMINKLTAVVAFLIYQAFNAHALAVSGKHLKPVPSALIIGTPYLFGWLLLLENVTLLQTMTFTLSAGLLAAWPALLEGLGRLLVVIAFNEVLANGISSITKGQVLKTVKAHLFLFLVSLGVVLAPSIANLASLPWVAGLPVIGRAFISILATMLSFAGLWGEVYLLTGILLDAGSRMAPTEDTIFKNVTLGMKKGMAYSGILMAILYALSMIFTNAAAQKVMASFPYAIGILAGALVFPFLKTIIETFDGSLPFFERTRYSYRSKTLYARGAVAGFGFAHMLSHGFIEKAMPDRILFGLVIGLIASGGISIIRDTLYGIRGQGKVQSWRLYFIDSLLGAFLGAALAFYLDAQQVPVILYKFKLYVTSIFSVAQYNAYPTFNSLGEMSYTTYPYLNPLGHYVQPVLISKWGQMDLGYCPGGVKLLFTESLDGVIKWSVATWLFAINKVFMQAFFDKDKTPIKFFFSKAGLAQLTELMIYVLRWGLWMSPIIYTFLRMMPVATWYNQDGAVRTLFAIYHNATMSPQAFQAWSLNIFLWVMAFDFFRILIWMDHMGLRVATLVNLSFLGMDKLDEKISKFIGPAVAQRYIPEGVKRFTTWAPLLIPFYLPRGEDWDYVWSKSEAMQNAARGKGLIPALQSLSISEMLILIGMAVVVCTGLSFVIRLLARRSRAKRIAGYELNNRQYKVVAKENAEIYSEVSHQKRDVYPKEYDVSRRSYDMVDPAGRILYLVDTSENVESGARYWPITGNFPTGKFQASHVERGEDSLKIVNTNHGIRTTVEIILPDQDSTAEIWKIGIENLTDKERKLKVVPYLEWVLNGGLHDRFHTQYQRLYPEMEYVSGANAILSWQKATKSMGLMALDISPEGFLTGRVDFIGRAKSIWSPRILETLDFLPARDTAAFPTFDPIGSFLVNATVSSKASVGMKLMIGYAKNRQKALDLIAKLLKPRITRGVALPERKKMPYLIGHGEIPQGTPQPYSEFIDNGNKLRVHTPYTPRPIDHAVSNALHSVMVTNRGLHTSCNGNSQQNRLTPDWPDTVTREIPSEAIYLYDVDREEWYSPTYHPLNDPQAKYESEFGVDGTAVFRMSHKTLATELTVFVPPQDPTGVYLLTVRNQDDRARRIRVAPYFQMVLSFMPEKAGPLQMRHDKTLDALYFENPRNIFRTGPAFVSMSIPAECFEIKRGKFFGAGGEVSRPFMVENGAPDITQLTDDGQIASFLGTMEIPARGEATVAIILGQTDERKQAVQIVQKYKNLENARKSLEETRKWWLNLMETVQVETTQPEFNRYQNWLKYQALAERIWPRRGFYQTSGAFGFRDQLQDTVNLMWVDPALARKQILLHAAQQFIEGDVFHWFFTLTDGRTAFSCRSHASDNPLWLAWGVGEYLKATEDFTILDEMASYVVSEFPFAPLPKNKQGWGHLYHRAIRADSVYRHCLRSIDLVLNDRMGKHGLPLMGVGDWNDGLDEIGSEGHGESVWLGFFLYYILKEMIDVIEMKDGPKRKEHYLKKMRELEAAIELTWREDRYLRAFHDDGTEIGVKDSGIWEIDALTAAWAVMSGINFDRGLKVFNTALNVLEKEDTILLGWPALREDTKPYLGRSSKYPEGVRENGMYCHGVQWLVKAARILAEQFEQRGDQAKADEYRGIAYRLWLKISPIPHVTPQKVEIYGGQPNKQSADMLTKFDMGRMIWHGYTGAAGWMLRQAMEGIVGASLIKNEMLLPKDLDKPRGALRVIRVQRDVRKSPLKGPGKS